MASNNADRNLLVGVLALQMEFLTREQLVTALSAWGDAKDKTLSQILNEHGVVNQDRQQLLDRLVNERFQQHDNDVERSLRSLALPPALRDELLQLADADVQASVRRISQPAAPPADEYATNFGVGDVPTQSEPPKAADPYATSTGGMTVDYAARPADPYATNVGSGTKTQPEINLAGPAPASGGSPSALRYRVVREYARGGLGEVMLATDDELPREVALKQIQKPHADDVESRARFEYEAEITGQLEHPGIVPVYGKSWYADGRPYYAMRLIRGESMKEWIDRFHKGAVQHADPSERTRQLHHLLRRFYDVCQAVNYAHSRGVLHRDLKPANIMLGTFGETYVVDWGLAKPVDRPDIMPENPDQKRVTLSGTASATPTLMGSAVGTPQFMSPEQAAGDLDKLGPQSDVYSLGATLYALLTGSAPITARDLLKALKRVQAGDFPKPRSIKSDIHPALEAICLKAMALKPEDRYPTPKELAKDIELWLADEPVSAWPEPWTMKTWRWVKRHRTMVSTAAAAVILVTLGLIVFGARERQLKLIAEKNYQMAREAVDRYDTHVSESLLLNEPDMKPLRQQLLADAGEFYEKFVEERKDDSNVKGELGRARYRLAKITADIESRDKAIALLRTAADTFEKDEATYRADLAECYHHLGRLHRMNDELAKSEEFYQKALTQWQGLRGKGEAQLAGWARSQLGLGNLYREMRRLEKASAEYAKAATTWSKLVEKKPSAPEPRRYQAVTHNNLGMVYMAMADKLSEARAEFAKAITIQEPLAKKHPNLSQVQSDLASSHYNLGKAESKARQNAAGVNSYQAAVRVLEKLTATHPSELAFRTRLVLAQSALANALVTEGKHKEAIAASERALEVQRETAHSRATEAEHKADLALRYSEHADVLRRVGDTKAAERAYHDAIEIQKKLVADKRDVLRYPVDLAGSYNNLGLLRMDQRQNAEAEKAFTQALEIWEEMQKKYPESAECARGIADACTNLRALTRSSATYQIALEPLDRVIGVYATVVRTGTEPALKLALFHAHWARAEARTAHELFDGAIQDWDQALALAPNAAEKTWVRIHRTISQARYGEAEAATKEANAILPILPDNVPEAFYQLARTYALAATAESKKNGEGADEAKTRAQQHAEQATKLLERARGLGYFQQAERRKKLNDSPDWQFLRSRESFQALLRNVQVSKTGP